MNIEPTMPHHFQKTLFLVCNAHLDPVWLWTWEEGLGAALATFRTAVRFCETREGFVFNHNEALLYQWIEEHDPSLLKKIQALVRAGKWHIMGGWYLQPDANLPSGESFVRQILTGRRYFSSRFGVEPRVAVNLDSFGHSRGLVQILKKSGYDGYLFCRPDGKWLNLPADDFLWEGYDGSTLTAHRAGDHYNSFAGKMESRIRRYLDSGKTRKQKLLLWGIGDHGGGPSAADLKAVDKIASENTGWKIIHSTPESYFETLDKQSAPRFSKSLNPWAVGCYTSMARVKQLHRRLENDFLRGEKITLHASLAGLMDYPRRDLQEALHDLLFCQFHDCLPGTSIAEVESYILQRLNHGLERINRLQVHAFFRLLQGQPEARPGEFPVLIYNPHPFPVDDIFTAEFQPEEPNTDSSRWLMPVPHPDFQEAIISQVEKESCNIQADQRKRICFRTTLPPGRMTRLGWVLEPVKIQDKPSLQQPAGMIWTFGNKTCAISINRKTGRIQSYRCDGFEFVMSEAGRARIMKDNADPWGMHVKSFSRQTGEFALMTPEQSARASGVSACRLPPVRIIENGPVRTTIESLFFYRDSTLCQRVRFPFTGREIEIELIVNWNEKDRMLKWCWPTPFKPGICRGEDAYGTQHFQENREWTAQRWMAVSPPEENRLLTIINDRIYGFDCVDGELRLSLLRSPAYSGHPVDGKECIVRQDRYETRMDTGTHVFRFWIQGGPFHDRLNRIAGEAAVKNQPPIIVSCNPAGGKDPLPALFSIEDPGIQITAMKKGEDSNWVVCRLFNPTLGRINTRLHLPVLQTGTTVEIDSMEIKTLAYDPLTETWFETDLMENCMTASCRKPT
ncbi:MAG TPA: alpha-mannosidase [bacterium]|nr:alpha-mannosidase [bacterium]